MSAVTEQVLQTALELPTAEQVLLVEALIAALDQADPQPLDDDWMPEIQRRSAEYDYQCLTRRTSMTATVKSLGIDQMTIEDRLALVQEIWDTIAAERSRSLLSEDQLRELQRRVAEDDASPDDVIPWEQVKAKVLARQSCA